MPDTALAPGSPSPLAQAISRFDCDIVMTAANRGAFNDAEGIERVQKLAVVDHLNILVLIEQKSVVGFIDYAPTELNWCLIPHHRYYALAAVAALMAHLENNLNIMFAPGTLRIYYSGTDKTAIIGKSLNLSLYPLINPLTPLSWLPYLSPCELWLPLPIFAWSKKPIFRSYLYYFSYHLPDLYCASSSLFQFHNSINRIFNLASQTNRAGWKRERDKSQSFIIGVDLESLSKRRKRWKLFLVAVAATNQKYTQSTLISNFFLLFIPLENECLPWVIGEEGCEDCGSFRAFWRRTWLAFVRRVVGKTSTVAHRQSRNQDWWEEKNGASGNVREPSRLQIFVDW